MGRYSVETVFSGRDRVSPALRGMAGNTRRARSQFDGFAGSLSKFAGGALSATKTMAMLGAAGAAASIAFLKPGADFEEAITAVGAVALKSRDQIADLEKEAKKLGATTKFTATESANAMEIMARAGFSNADILAGVGPVLNAASASGMEIAEVADHVSNALKGMGLETSEAGRVADVLALASSKTNSSIGSLGESIRNVASTARQFRIPLEEVTASVALLQDVGLDASVAGSAFNTMLTKMAKPTDEIAAQMKEFGVTFKDANGDMIPFIELLDELSVASQKSGGNMDKVAFLADLVGLRGQKAAANLADLFDSGRVEELTEQLYAAGGAAEKMAALRMNNLKGDITLLDSAVDGLRTDLYETESGPMRDLVQGITKWVELNKGDIVSGFQKFMVVAKELAGIFGESFMSTITEIGAGLKVMFPPDQNAGEQWIEILKGFVKGLGQMYAVAVTVAAGVGALLVGVAAVASGTFGAIKGIGEAIVNFLGDIVFSVTDWWANLGALWDAQGLGLVDKTIAIGKHLVTGLVNGIKSVAMAPYNALKGIATGALDGAKSALGINSPSKKMFEIGVDTVAGFDQAIDKLMPNIGDIMSSKLNPANNNAAPEIQSIQSANAARMEQLIETGVSGEVVLRNETGARAEVTSQKGPVGLRVASTGAA